jgi:hypothetical protein
MLSRIKALLDNLFGPRRPSSLPPVPRRSSQQSTYRLYPSRTLEQYVGEGSPPPLRWKASHPSTIRRFKAEVTCSRGHGITLRDHTIEADGQVLPSIVCKRAGCTFHEVVRLEGWSAGRIPATPKAPAAAA